MGKTRLLDRSCFMLVCYLALDAKANLGKIA